MAYATVDELRRYIQSGGAALPTTDDDLLIMFLEDAQQIIDDYTGRTFEASAATTRTFDALADLRTLDTLGPYTVGGVDRTLWLGGGELAEAPTSVVNGDGTTVSASEYVTEPRNEAPYYALTLKSGSNVVWTYSDSPEGAISVTGYWGYSRSADSLIRGATLALAAWIYRQRSTSADTDRPILTGDGVTILPAALPKNAFERLTARRRLV